MIIIRQVDTAYSFGLYPPTDVLEVEEEKKKFRMKQWMPSYDVIIVHYFSCDRPDHPLSIDMLSVFFSFLVPVEDTPIVWRLRSVAAAKAKQRFSRRLIQANQERFGLLSQNPFPWFDFFFLPEEEEEEEVEELEAEEETSTVRPSRRSNRNRRQLSVRWLP
jgi:hypothetical protein